MKLMSTIGLAFLAVFALALPSPAQSPHSESDSAAAKTDPANDQPVYRNAPWSARVVELASSLPIQDGGRIKPLSTFAGFSLLRLNGKRTLTTPGGAKLTPIEWLLDILFFPDSASNYENFLVQNDEVVDAIGLHIEGKQKRDRYSYNQLEPGFQKLFSLAQEYSKHEERDRTAVESQIVHLAENIEFFVRISRHEPLALIAPATIGGKTDDWFTLPELSEAIANKSQLADDHRALYGLFQNLVTDRSEPPKFEADLSAFHDRSVLLADRRGEYSKVPLEVTYYKADLITWSLSAFVIAFLAAATMWMKPKSKWLHRLTSFAVLSGSLLLVGAIVMRCMIRGRPPVSTLYETVLFVTAVGTLLALGAELLNRQRLAVSAAAVLGMIGLFVANGYETLDKQDTMPSLVAVLDTNFWLATHVTAITVGYSAGMFAALLANIYLFAKITRIKRGDANFFRTLSKTTYGVLCFGVIFSTVGTILGGIWANESWGRFWGWDPKENGALLIVLSELVILHGRMGGYLREFGICMAAGFVGSVIAFSWWGVNLLGVGLHSYGFTQGIHTALWIYYAIQWSLVALGGVTWLMERSAKTALAAAKHQRGERELDGEAGAAVPAK